MKKIIHLTDLHIGEDKCGVDKKKKCDAIAGNIIGNIITSIKNPAEYIVIVTGDLVEKESADGLQPSPTFCEPLSNSSETLVFHLG